MKLRNRLKKRILWLPHNLIAHPLMAILPRKIGNKIHDITIPKFSNLDEPQRTSNE